MSVASVDDTPRRGTAGRNSARAKPRSATAGLGFVYLRLHRPLQHQGQPRDCVAGPSRGDFPVREGLSNGEFAVNCGPDCPDSDCDRLVRLAETLLFFDPNCKPPLIRLWSTTRAFRSSTQVSGL